MLVGYARVSSTGQNLQSQLEALQKAGCEKIFEEKKSGTKSYNRPELQSALDYVRDGDTLIVTRLDRCSRNVKDLHTIIDRLNEKGVAFKATEQELDTSTSAGRLMIGLLSIVSAFETDLRAERQADGIKSALKRGVKFGREAKFDDARVIEAMALQEQGKTNQEIAVKFGIGRSTLLRYIANYKKTCETPPSLTFTQNTDWEELPLNPKKKVKRYYVPRKDYPLKVTVHKKPKDIKSYNMNRDTNSIHYDRVTLQFGTDKNNWFYNYVTTIVINLSTNNEILEEIYEIVGVSSSPDKDEIEGMLIPYFDKLYSLTPKAIERGFRKYEKENAHLEDTQEEIDISSLDFSDPFNPFPTDYEETLVED